MFNINKILTGESMPLEYIKGAAGEEITLGEALKLGTKGVATKASGTDTAKYICAGVKDTNEAYPLLQIRSDMEFLADSTVAITDALNATAVTISADGMGITATAAATGGFYILEVKDNIARGYFK